MAYASGSLVLPWFPLLGHYEGTWTNGTDWYDCSFFRDFATHDVHASANWNVSGHLDTGSYPTKTLAPAPMPTYEVATLVSFDATWLVKLIITG